MVFGFQTVGIAVLLAWLYQRSGQSLILAMLFHGWRNSIEAFYPPIDMLARSIAVVIIWAVVLVVVAVERRCTG